jgi:gamma-glutamyltranspeptidase/glutathione hydrolase
VIAAASAPHPSRAVARSTRAMVATPHALATAAGCDVLRRGGNAVDAAIAANAVLCVVYPASCGIGGDALWMVYDPRTSQARAYNGSGRTARAAQRADLPGGIVPTRGPRSVSVPGAVRSWEELLGELGTRDLDALLAPAETLARDGFVVTDVVSAYIAECETVLRADDAAAAIFVSRGVPRPGDVLRNADLADTLAAIRRGGADAYYGGEPGHRIVAALRAGGNPMTLDDFTSHRTEPMTPLSVAWQGMEVVVHPPNSQGACTALALGMLAADGDASAPLWNHLAIEAMKRAIAIRNATFCDPDFAPSGIERELGASALRTLRATIDPDHASPAPRDIDQGDTIAVCVVDEDGLAVSLIESLFSPFGSGMVAPGTGVVLHNRGSYFSVDASAPNAFAGGKRPLHTLSPAMALRDGRPAVVFGTMGGDGQPQIQLQVLHNLIERGLDVQQSLDAPRWIYGRHVVPGRPELADAPSVLIESRLDADVVAGLARRGHRIESVGPFSNAMGHAHAIVIDRERGSLAGGADPRADSSALGL